MLQQVQTPPPPTLTYRVNYLHNVQTQVIDADQLLSPAIPQPAISELGESQLAFAVPAAKNVEHVARHGL